MKVSLRTSHRVKQSVTSEEILHFADVYAEMNFGFRISNFGIESFLFILSIWKDLVGAGFMPAYLSNFNNHKERIAQLIPMCHSVKNLVVACYNLSFMNYFNVNPTATRCLQHGNKNVVTATFFIGKHLKNSIVKKTICEKRK